LATPAGLGQGCRYPVAARDRVVVGHGQVFQADGDRLLGQLFGLEAAIAAHGVAVEVEPGGAAGRRDPRQN
jgi:hypothetical protein